MDGAKLMVIEGPQAHLNELFFISSQEDFLLGRSTLCHIQLDDALVSSLHCYFTCEQGNFVVYDLVSANGILVNKQLVDFMSLHSGDLIKIGKSLLRFDDAQPPVTGAAPSPEPEIDKKTTLGRMIKKQRDLNICRLGLKNRLLTHAQIRQLLHRQKQAIEQGDKKDLADFLISEGLLSPEKIDSLLQENNYLRIRSKDIHFGNVVVEQNLVGKAEVDECLALQQRYFHETGEIPRLGEILVQKDYLTIKQNNMIIRAIAQKPKD